MLLICIHIHKEMISDGKLVTMCNCPNSQYVWRMVLNLTDPFAVFVSMKIVKKSV